jgi:hypothetical protein
MTMKTTRRITLAVALAAVSITGARAQSTAADPVVGGLYDEEKHHVDLSDAAWRVGIGIGPSIGTEASLINDARVQERIFVRRQFNDLLQAEAGLGVHRVAGNYLADDEYDTHFWTLDARALLAPALDDQWNPYAFAGIGLAFWRVIDPADETIVSEADFAVREEGIGAVIPLGLGVQFKPERQSRLAFDFGVGYSLILDDEIDGAAGGDNVSTINGSISIEYLFHDAVERNRETVAAD